MVIKPFYYPTRGNEPQNRHVRLELSIGKGDLERSLLPSQPVGSGRHQRLRRTAVLHRTLRYRRGEFDVLRPAPARSHPRLVPADAGRLRILGQAVSEVHPPQDVQGGGLEDGPPSPGL